MSDIYTINITIKVIEIKLRKIHMLIFVHQKSIESGLPHSFFHFFSFIPAAVKFRSTKVVKACRFGNYMKTCIHV